jgi:hypothetical protein
MARCSLVQVSSILFITHHKYTKHIRDNLSMSQLYKAWRFLHPLTCSIWTQCSWHQVIWTIQHTSSNVCCYICANGRKEGRKEESRVNSISPLWIVKWLLHLNKELMEEHHCCFFFFPKFIGSFLLKNPCNLGCTWFKNCPKTSTFLNLKNQQPQQKELQTLLWTLGTCLPIRKLQHGKWGLKRVA